jgi:hypothetical protein
VAAGERHDGVFIQDVRLDRNQRVILDQVAISLVRAVGVKSNRDGIGAKVKVVSGDLMMIDEVRSGGSYISQNDMRLHFGLEKRAKIDLIEIRWPSGVVDKITNLNANKLLTVREGRGLVEQKDVNKKVTVGAGGAKTEK